MKKFGTKITSAFLSLVMLVSLTTSTFAATISEEEEPSSIVIVVDDGVYINDIFYSQAEFLALLNDAIEMPAIQTYGAVAGTIAAGVGVIEGTWWIPGVGQVLVTAGGVILLGGAVVAVGSWLYNAITKWFADRAYDKSAEDAVNGVDLNRQNHILNNRLHNHGWNNLFNGRDPQWRDLAPILIKVLQDGTETLFNASQRVYERTLNYNGYDVVVRFRKTIDGLVETLTTAYVR
ncbi:MAG: hypothetical protein K2M15_09850 [Oscillospiraceae bacterium]|nr:hypothetical protein [Oscillospiraceae bacterium]MDE7171625.1 hypothetical protein [Oscillospiraceae bacterium]